MVEKFYGAKEAGMPQYVASGQQQLGKTIGVCAEKEKAFARMGQILNKL